MSLLRYPTLRNGALLATIVLTGALVASYPSAAEGATGSSLTGVVFLDSTATHATTGQVQVEVTPDGTTGVAPIVVPVTAQGRYTFSNLAAGPYDLYFRYIGSGSYASTFYEDQSSVQRALHTVDPTSSDAMTSDLSQILYPTSTITGHVSLGSAGVSAGQGEVAVQYSVLNDLGEGHQSAPVLTDASGNYSFTGLGSSTGYSLYFDYLGTGGFQSQYWDENVTSGGISFALGGEFGQTSVVKDQTLPLAVALTGHVYLGNQAHAAGVGEATVTIHGTVNNKPFSKSTTTDASGSYTIGGLRSQNLTAFATYNGTDHLFAAKTYDLDVRPGTASADFTLAGLFTLSGHVDVESAGQSAGAGEVWVGLVDYSGLNLIQETSTDAAGNYSFSAIPTSNYLLVYDYSHHDNAYNWGPAYQRLTVTGTQSAPPFVMPVAGAISGHVRSSTGAALSGITVYVDVYLALNAPPIFTRQVVTDATGAYDVRGLAAGRYVVSFEDPNGRYASMSWNGASYFYVPDTLDGTTSQHFAGIDETLYRVSSLTGRITAPGADFSDVDIDVQVFDSESQGYVDTDSVYPVNADGSYEIDGLAPDRYRFNVQYSGPRGEASTVSAETQFAEGSHHTFNASLPLPQLPEGTVKLVRSLYSDFLDREPSQSEIANWGDALQRGFPQGEVAGGFVNSDEYRLIRIDAAYQGILGRPAEAGGRMSWLNGMKRGTLTTDDIEQSLFVSEEFFQKVGNGNNLQWVEAMYDYILGRSASFSEAIGWTFQLNEGRLTRTQLVSIFWRSVETSQVRAAALFWKYLGRSATQADTVQWGQFILAHGDSAARSAITGGAEYYSRAQARYSTVGASAI